MEQTHKTNKTGAVLLCDVSTGSPRPIVPTQYRRKVFDVIHSLAHPGRKATQKLISDKFVWHNLKKDVKQWAKQRLPCQSSKIQKHVHASPDTIVVVICDFCLVL